MARYALVQDGLIINWIEWDGKTPYAPPEGTTVMTAAKAKNLPEMDRSALPSENTLEQRVAALEKLIGK